MKDTGWHDGGRSIGPFRWRGHLNWKDILERAIGGSMAGFTAGGTFFLLSRFFE